MNKAEFTQALETKLKDHNNCVSCGLPFVSHDGITRTCDKLQKALVLLRDLHDFGNPTNHYVHRERAEKAFKDAAALLREMERKCD